jgi:uncharacterized repeat protein (TIGR03803 family)
MSHAPTKLTAKLAALIAAATLASPAVAGAAIVGQASHATRAPGHHRVGPNVWTEQVVYSFQGGSDGASPWGDLVQSGGALYSTTLFGGTSGIGTVFKLAPSHGGFTESIVHAFSGGGDGAYPWQGLTSDLSGSLYGIASSGGAANAGTAFKLSSKGEATIYSFQGTADGAYPTGFPNEDIFGNVYGTTENGGSAGNGTVFALSPSRGGGYSEQTLYSFQGGNDGQNPHGGLLEDLFGALYGTTYFGGTSGAGTVFKITPSWGGVYSESVIHSFTGSDGSIPNASLIEDWTGALYGTATWGGSGFCSNSYGGFGGCGTVFKLTPSWSGGYTETTLYSFQGGSDGSGPNGDLLKDSKGNIYGTTYYGGANGAGTVFVLTPQRNGSYLENIVWSFGGTGDGARPAGGLTSYGNALYGTTARGGTNNQGTVFSLTP